MLDRASLIDVKSESVDQTGFFCYMSKRKTEGWACKLQWVKKRLAEGMRIKFSACGNRAFIEYIPGEYAWRPIKAKGYMVIHCIWVVGQSKGRGLAKQLIRDCVRDAEESGMHGVAMVTGRERWMISRSFLEKQGFVPVDAAPPSFELMVRKFDSHPDPRFIKNLAERSRRYARGMTIFASDQCPYFAGATRAAQAAARQLRISCRVVRLKSAHDVRQLSPSPCGAFSIVFKGHLLSHHMLGTKEIIRRIAQGELSQ